MRNYQVVGDLSADRNSEVYPVLTLCDECVKKYDVIVVEDLSTEPCDECGCCDEDNSDTDQ